ncbi:EF-P 5-aminopentanol modification-associated protein YfmH [uncultured Subdoligranulum sp.]|uniref:EF-P 5-aminopentanol modification-associated protein YfmH n=1 Tax=uncultured Subdoligranulum sp. TaxID=512298 RepID=UPI0026341587|nr:pitrilysin family protein [uncultured Subdoligranulum sp.]
MCSKESFAAVQARAAAAVGCQRTVLPSGLTVLCRTMPGYSSVHAIYAAAFGSIHREFVLDGKPVSLPAGTAHFLEHKMCETPQGDSFSFYAKTGASANAFTSYDRTCYLFSATQKIDENLDILLGMVGKPWFTKATIAKEQGIIGQEIKMYDDSPDWRLLNALFRCLYSGHPLRDDIAGTVDSIAQLTPQLLYSCTKAFYAPSNMVLSVAGKITLDQAVEACKRNGLYRARPGHQVEWDIPAEEGPVLHHEAGFTMPVNKPCFGVAYREPPLEPGDLKRELLLDMLGDLVAGGLTTLYRKLYDEALVNPEFSGDFIAVRGACAVAFTGESDTPREVAALLQAEIERLRTEGIDPELFTLVKNQMYGELLGDVETVDDAAEEAAAACLKGRTLADEIAALAALTVEDANALLQTALREENRAYVQIDPQDPCGE